MCSGDIFWHLLWFHRGSSEPFLRSVICAFLLAATLEEGVGEDN